MIKFNPKVVLIFASWILGAGQCYAGNGCGSDVRNCTPKQLCEASTSIVNNNKIWSIDPNDVEHVALSKHLGIKCGVVDTTEPTCNSNAEVCAVSALCEQATVTSDAVKAWSDVVSKAGHVRLAKEYGLDCGVGVKMRISVQNCWNVGSLSTEALKARITIGVSILPTGLPDAESIRLVKYEGASEQAARQAFEAGRRAIIRCGAKGFQLTKEQYDQWKYLELVFDPKEMRMK
jgi:hypothetical protein